MEAVSAQPALPQATVIEETDRAATSITVSPQQARERRAALQRAASFVSDLREVEQDAAPSGWDMLEAVPTWVLSDAGQLRRLALLTGALYAASTLQMCLEAKTIRAMAGLIGRRALDAVMEADPPLSDPTLVDALLRSPQNFYVRSVALLLDGVSHPDLRTALIQRLGLAPQMAQLPTVDPERAAMMAEQAAVVLRVIAAREQADAEAAGESTEPPEETAS